MRVARPAAQGQLVFVAIAFGCLTYAFVDERFLGRVRRARIPIRAAAAYRIAGVWGGHEGSLLLWVLMLGVWMVAVTRLQPRTCPTTWWRACSA